MGDPRCAVAPIVHLFHRFGFELEILLLLLLLLDASVCRVFIFKVTGPSPLVCVSSVYF